jgi:hypothetical protein
MNLIFRKLLRSQNNMTKSCSKLFQTLSLNEYHTKFPYILVNEDNNRQLKSEFYETSIKLNMTGSNKYLTKEMPYIWLRDNCKCEKCIDAKVHEMKYDFTRESTDIKPVEIIQLPLSDSKTRFHFQIRCKQMFSNQSFKNNRNIKDNYTLRV